jgi:hypothetical protein
MMSGNDRPTEHDGVGLPFAGVLGPHASANAEE